MVKDMYMVQTRSQAKAQANAPSVQNTTGKSVAQNAIPKVDKIPIKTEKEKEVASSRFGNTNGKYSSTQYTSKCEC